MIDLHEFCDVNRPVDEVFDYVSDFTTTTEWDATAIEAIKVTQGPVAMGTRYRVLCALPVGSIRLDYEVVGFQRGKKIELHGTGRLFDIRDTITFSSTPTGTRVDYRAEISLKPFLSRFTEKLKPGLENMGRESVAGLKSALDDNFPLPADKAEKSRAERMVIPEISMFTRLGYTQGRKRFNPMSTSIKGKHVVISGASAGLGKVVAMELARRGAYLTLIIRGEEKARDTVEAIHSETGNSNVEYILADLSIMSEVDRVIAVLEDRGRPIDTVINNAGALFNPRQETPEGLEQSFALLLLSPYRLTEGLKPLLLKADSPRVINVVSGGMYSQKLEVQKLDTDVEGNYSGSEAYARQKRALMVLTEQWAKQWMADGIVVNAMHPGWADTPGVQTALPEFRRLTRKVLRSPLEGADTIVWLAVAKEAATVSGKLFLDRQQRSTHLLRRTRETAGAGEELMDFLSHLEVPVSK